MAKEENLDQLLAQLKEHDEKQAALRDRIKASAVGEAASIRDKVNSISSLSGISKFELLGITKEEALTYFGIKEKKTGTQAAKKTLTKDDEKVKEVRATIIDREIDLPNGKTVIIKEKGPLPKEVRKMILAGELK